MTALLRAHLHLLPSPIREQALANADKVTVPNTDMLSVKTALIRLFSWDSSPEGDAYWEGVFTETSEADPTPQVDAFFAQEPWSKLSLSSVDELRVFIALHTMFELCPGSRELLEISLS